MAGRAAKCDQRSEPLEEVSLRQVRSVRVFENPP
jgi:hypothetical protein